MRFIRIALIALGCLQGRPLIGGDMITANILQRVRQIRVGADFGTAFTADVGGRQYLVTARHVLGSLPDLAQVLVRSGSDWLPLAVRRLEVLPPEVDIGVLALNDPVSPSLTVTLSADGVVLSEDLFFLGFPYGLSMDGTAQNAGYPFPFVKRATCSAFVSEGGFMRLFLDGFNNPGFSGGPVVSMRGGPKAPIIVGVVSGYRFEELPVLSGGRPTNLTLRSNTGIVVASGIQPALEAITRDQARPTFNGSLQ